MKQDVKILVSSNWVKNGNTVNYKRVVILLLSVDGKPHEISVDYEVCTDPINYDKSDKSFCNGDYFYKITSINEEIIKAYNERVKKMFQSLFPEITYFVENEKKYMLNGLRLCEIKEQENSEIHVYSSINVVK